MGELKDVFNVFRVFFIQMHNIFLRVTLCIEESAVLFMQTLPKQMHYSDSRKKLSIKCAHLIQGRKRSLLQVCGKAVPKFQH